MMHEAQRISHVHSEDPQSNLSRFSSVSESQGAEAPNLLQSKVKADSVKCQLFGQSLFAMKMDESQCSFWISCCCGKASARFYASVGARQLTQVLANTSGK